MNFTNDWLIAVEQTHETAHVAAHHGVISHRIPRSFRIVISLLYFRIHWRACRPLDLIVFAAKVLLCTHDQIITTAKTFAVSGKCNHVYSLIEVRAVNAGSELNRHVEGNSVAPLRAVERNACYCSGYLVSESV